ncbi:myeloid-derived growth factor-like [Littorina saxatilis]|uniref:Myeloid-derived growth factor n=1 Tax=Littorina saxatilis TaxID=31220 RepID=A0AAN9C255_9CAEN
MKWFVIVTIFVCNIAQDLCDDSTQDVFFVKPGGQTTVYEKEWNGFKCSFQYQAQGGTHEQWQVSMETIDDGQSLMCTIARGQTSYLFFETFTMTLSGPGVKLQQFEAIKTEGKPLAENEYKVNKKANTLMAAPGQFKNQLEKITLLGSLGKTEL